MSQHSLIFTLFLLVLFFTSTHVGAKEQNFDFIQNPHQRANISLDGQWHRIIDPFENGYYNHRYEPHKNGYFKNAKAKNEGDLVEYNFATAPLINVPGDWNTQEEPLFLYEGTVWYQKSFKVEKITKKRYVLHFGAVNYKAIVYVNGTKVGEHEGGFTSFQFDVTEQIKDKDNFVIVKVDNRRERDQVPTVNTDWWNYGGITRSVSLLELPERYLADYSVRLNDKGDGVTGMVSVSSPGKKDEVTVSIPELEINTKVKLDAKGMASFDIKADPSLWSPQAPKLYDVSFAFNGETVKDKIGFRSLKVEGTEIFVNGKSMFLRGISIHEESPFGGGRAWSEADARTLLTWAKELGCNFVRLAHYPHNEMMLKIADELGLLVWSEIPVYWTVMFDSEEVYAKAEKQLTEMITRDKNRASIIMWSVANETPVEDARLTFLSKLIKTARALDPSRLITAAMDTQSTSANGKLIDDPLAKYVDIIGINSYCGWYSAKPADCSKLRWESHYEKPIIMSEVGAGALKGRHDKKDVIWTEEFQADVYVHNIEMMENMPTLRGVTPWILKDFRSPRRPLDNIQDFWNRKGLLSEKGERKLAWYVLRDFYLKKAAE
jgi:beta-glucuronidase